MVWEAFVHVVKSWRQGRLSKDMITAFTCPLSYRYSSFTLRAYLCWRDTYSPAFCQWPIIEFAKNVSPKWEQNGRYPRGPDSYTCALSADGKKWPTRHIAVPTGNPQASQQSIYRENRVKLCCSPQIRSAQNLQARIQCELCVIFWYQMFLEWDLVLLQVKPQTINSLLDLRSRDSTF